MERRKRKISVLCILSMLAVILLGVVGMEVQVYATEVPPFYKYELAGSSGEYVLTIYSEGDEDVAIGKDELDDWLQYSCSISKSDIKEIVIRSGIKTIDDFAFNGFNNVVTVTIPDTVTSIGEDAFANCGALTSVTIPSGVVSISSGTFYFCTSLAEASIPDTVTNIGDGAFSACSLLKEITIPSSVTSIGDYAFDSCSSLEEIVIPDSITSISEYVFNECTSLTTVAIPDSVTSIGDSAFSSCSSLAEITIPSSVTSIGNSVFSKCTSLAEITIPSSVTSIGNSVFSKCTSLKEIYVPGNVKSIGGDVFAYCSALTKVILGEGLEVIGGEAFLNCTNLQEVHIPSTVQKMYSFLGETNTGNIFYGCEKLTYIHMYADPEYITRGLLPYEGDPEYKEHTPFRGLEQTMYMYVPSDVEVYKNEYEENSYWGVGKGGKIIFSEHSHTLVEPVRVQATPATCTEDGNIEYYKCATSPLCGELFTDETCQTPVTDIVIPKGHDLGPATCTGAPKCKREGCDYTEGTSLGGHDMTAATCTDAPKCKREGCNYTEGVALGHTYGSVTFVWNADYSKATASCTCANDDSHILSSDCVITSKVVKEATTTEKGEKVYTATVNLDGKTYTEDKSVEIPMLEADKDDDDKDEDDKDDDDKDDDDKDDEDDDEDEDDEDDEDSYVEYEDVDLEVDDVPDSKNAIVLNEKVKVTQTGSQINIKWGKVKKASGYDIYVQYCGKKFKKTPTKTVKGNKKTSYVVKKVNGKKLNLTKNFKVRVVAYKTVDGKKVVLAKSLTAHVVGRKNKKYTNVKSITVKKTKETIKVGKTKTIKAKVNLQDKKKKQLSKAHAAEFRYVSSNKKVATVSKKGKIKALKKGKCDIYVYAKNGFAKKIKVTVK